MSTNQQWKGWGSPVKTSPDKGPKEITIVIPYYDNPTMLEMQLKQIRDYYATVRAYIELIVVDDGSPRWPAKPVTDPEVPFRLYRCLVDVRWNWVFCRNLAASVAKYRWLLMTDIDHLIPNTTILNLIYHRYNINKAYRFQRVSAPSMLPYKPHPNTWFMHKGLFDAVGGYDERFSGWYGSDADFRRRITTKAGDPVTLEDVVIRIPRDLVPDASTTTYKRKTPEDRQNVARIKAEIAQDPKAPTKQLTFPWEQIL
jgi:hypothetical protein